MGKDDNGKPEPTLVYSSLIIEVAKVRRYGISKYGSSERWREVESIRYFDAMLRHIYAYLDGEDDDAESRLSHLAHTATNVMFEIERRHRAISSTGGVQVEWTCPRCGKTDYYPSRGVHRCSGGCGYLVEPEI